MEFSLKQKNLPFVIFIRLFGITYGFKKVITILKTSFERYLPTDDVFYRVNDAGIIILIKR
ncbi:hypothetical protein GCM10026983_17570 [Gracilibacillus alcaliphilus]